MEWGFASTTSSTGLGGAAGVSAPVTQHYGLGTAGFGITPGFGLSGGQQFNYGIISGYDNPNPAVSGGTFVKNSATFVLSGLPTNFDIKKIGNVRFQYGTSLNEPSTYYVSPPPPPQKVPEPTTTAALGVFVVGSLRLMKKTNKRELLFGRQNHKQRLKGASTLLSQFSFIPFFLDQIGLIVPILAK